MNIYCNEYNLKGLLDQKHLIGAGASGKVYVYNKNTLIKVFKNNLFNCSEEEYITRLSKCKKEEEYKTKSRLKLLTKKEQNEYMKKRLSYTKNANDFILGSLLYDDYAFGLVLNYYRNFLEVSASNLKSLSNSEKITIFHNLKETLKDFHSNYIYPFDIKESNVLFDPNSLEVKYIDLDDSCTIYANEENDCYKSYTDKKLDTLKTRVLELLKI